MKFLFLFYVCLFASGFALGQQDGIIEGKVLGATAKDAIPFANVYNKTLKRGTITNADGYFRVEYATLQDTFVVSQVGYLKGMFVISAGQSFYTVELEENARELEEVIIGTDQYSFLFEYLNECRKNASTGSANAKAYYELKSYCGAQQLELVEGYYNMQLSGYEIKDLSLKSARLALQPYEDRLYTSQAGSRAIAMLKMTGPNDFFPSTPLDLSRKDAKRIFNLAVEQRYRDEKNDSIYVISYWPKKEEGKAFEGEIWMNKTRFRVEKMTMNCSKCTVHPFLPLFPDDSVLNVALNITKTFVPVNGKMVFQHVDFSYSTDYKSRVGRTDEFHYSVKTAAVLYAYDFERLFDVPKFDFIENVSDYRKINAFPYNSFFWENNSEYRLNDENNANERFFLDSNSTTNITFFKSRNKGEITPAGEWKRSEQQLSKRGYFEHPYIQWSTNRIFLKEMTADTAAQAKLGAVNSLQYNLEVQTFFDVNEYNDSVNVLTATVFDPFTTYYYLPIDKYANCFINMYFDWCEIQRRNWEASRKPGWDVVECKQSYDLFLTQLSKQKALFLKETDRGTNRKAMEKWNSCIVNAIGIDNIALFKLYEEE